MLKIVFTFIFLFYFNVQDLAHGAMPTGDPFVSLLDKGLKESFAVKNQQHSLEQSQITYKNSLTQLLPTLSLSAGETRSSGEYIAASGTDLYNAETISRTATLSANWSLWNNFQSIRDIRTTSLSKKIAELDFQNQKEEYALQLFQAFMKYEAALYGKKAQATFEEQAKWSFEQSQLLVRVGAQTEFEALDSEIEYLNAQRSTIEYETQIKESLQSLQLLLSCKSCSEFAQIDLENYKPHFLDQFKQIQSQFTKDKIDMLTENNPNVIRSKLDLDSSMEGLSQDRLSLWPQTYLTLSHTYDMSKQLEDKPVNDYRPNLNSTTLSLSLNWTFWDWWATPRKVRSAELGYEIKSNLFSEATQKTRNDFDLLFDQLISSTRSVEITKIALEKSEKQIRFSKQLFQLGKINLLSMQQSMGRLYNARISHINGLMNQYILIGRILVNTGHSILPLH